MVRVEFIKYINASIIDFSPALASLPKILQPWRKYWDEMGRSHHDVFVAWWEPVKQAIANGTAAPSFVRDVLLQKDTKYRGDDEEAMYLTTLIVAAGSDNVRMAMNVFVMSILCNPEAIRKARNEIDGIWEPR